MSEIKRESIEYDVVIVGAGPAGLSAAIKLKQLNSNLQVVVLEKGSEVGSHIISGAVLDPIGLNKIFPNPLPRNSLQIKRLCISASGGFSRITVKPTISLFPLRST